MSNSLHEYSKALKSLELALNLPESDIVRDASIQRFEFCVELAWKTSKKVMGSSTSAPKQLVREMAQESLIDDIELWFSALEGRNLSSHTYNEALANRVYALAKKFLPAAKALELKLKDRS